MEEKVLFRLALIGTILGILALYIITEYYNPSINVSDIDKSMVGRDVKVTAKVVEKINTKKMILLKLSQDNKTIKAVYFKTNYPYFGMDDIALDTTFTFKGTVNIWKNELQIIIEDMEI